MVILIVVMLWPGSALMAQGFNEAQALALLAFFSLLNRFLIYNIYLYIKCYLENKSYNAPKCGVELCVILLLIVCVLYHIYKKCARTKNE